MKRLMKTSHVIVALVAIVSIAISGCSDNNSPTEKNTKGTADTIKISASLKSFFDEVLPTNYHFYALKNSLPITMDDMRANGIFVGSRVPDGLLPPNVIGILYGGGFVNGTVVVLDKESDFMEKFHGIKLQVAIRVMSDSCLEALSEKQIILFSDDDYEKVTDKKKLVQIKL